MPVPPLPLELIALVCEHLETPVWSPHEPVPDGLSMALTCRAWKGLGYRLMLRRTEIFLTMHPTGRGNRLARLLLEKPSLCSYIEELKLRTGLFEYAGLDDVSEEEFVHRLLSQTSSIRLLRLSPPSRRTPQYLQALPPTVFSDPLRTLHLDCAGFRPSAIDRVLDTLARLPRLDSLCLSPSKPGLARLEINCEADVYDASLVRSIVTGVLDAIRTESVRSLSLVCADEDFPSFLKMIMACSDVRHLRIVLSRLPFECLADIKTGGFSKILEVTSTLKHLRVLGIEQPPEGLDERPGSPLPIETFLALFAPTIRRLDFSCCQFENDWFVVPLYEPGTDGLIVRRQAKVRNWELDDRHGDEFTDLVEVENLEGIVCWRRMDRHQPPPALSQLPPVYH
ncbi:hypothetical protein NBRC10512_004599 [Rhodotorula toruloides]|uniref:F-box domain-containing protein n=1 Tax=Rhodotorula toruloides (strain NP11) TaxID=1130832 RepID=M7XFV2_RHOT1|nr:uncharacterized protein RHTO_05395 [Rhodotorula toruloides NP11]EMS19023.1 hypothetical protein RHTO_05395 [Rhodotorula toruloides NP11]